MKEVGGGVPQGAEGARPRATAVSYLVRREASHNALRASCW